MNIKLDPQIHWLLITIEMWIKGFVNKLNIQWPHRLTLNFHWFKLNGRWTRRGVDRRTKWWRCQWIHRFHCCCLLFNSISGRLFSLSATIQWSASSFIGPNEWKQGKSFFLSISAAIVTEKWLDDLQQQTNTNQNFYNSNKWKRLVESPNSAAQFLPFFASSLTL